MVNQPSLKMISGFFGGIPSVEATRGASGRCLSLRSVRSF